MTALVRDILSRMYPDRTPIHVTRIDRGNRKRTSRVIFADRTLAVQHCPVDRGTLDTERFLCCAIVDRTDVPVSDVIESGTIDGRAYLVTEWVDGTPLHERFSTLDSATRRVLARTMGQHLGDLHRAFTFEDYGPIAVADDDLVITEPASDWVTYFRDLVEDGLAAFHGPLAALRTPIRDEIESSLDVIPMTPTPRLFPWDFRPGNILVCDEKIVAVLDWDAPLSTHREFSLAKAEYLLVDWYFEREEREALRKAFYDGYSLPVPRAYWDERRRLYRLGAIVRAAFDSNGDVTRPRYPLVDAETAVDFHREHILDML